MPSCLFWLKPQNLTYEISFSRRDDLIISESKVIEIKDPNTLLLVCLFVCSISVCLELSSAFRKRNINQYKIFWKIPLYRAQSKCPIFITVLSVNKHSDSCHVSFTSSDYILYFKKHHCLNARANLLISLCLKAVCFDRGKKVGAKTPITLVGSIYHEVVSRRVGYRKTPDLFLGFSFT